MGVEALRRTDRVAGPPRGPEFLLQNAQAYTYAELQGLTYLQVKGSGLANTCPVIDAPNTDGKVKAGTYKVDKMCLEPTSFTVKEDSQFKGGESEFVKTKLMTRLTYSLDAISGDMKVGGDGSVEFTEKDGIDYAPVTVQLPGGERVPFLFSIKNFAAKGNLSAFGGEFSVPSYRGSSFLDPKVRIMSSSPLEAIASLGQHIWHRRHSACLCDASLPATVGSLAAAPVPAQTSNRAAVPPLATTTPSPSRPALTPRSS